ncbi:hypothetical protein [Teredinibacter turnerae]|uniref:hypothetical protein n=1 Tax=Teredinibacter turnerae TaxID=2426 RepID=UPI0030CE9BEE
MSFEAKIGINSSISIEGESAIQVVERWLMVFCPSRKDFKRNSPNTQMLWDSISGDVYGEKAIEMYKKEEALQYYILDDAFETTNPHLLIIEDKPV